jgi:Bacterial Ig-like domain
MTGPEYGDGSDVYLDHPELEETAAVVRRTLGSDVMRPAFRDQLRARLVAERAQAIAAGATTPVPPAAGPVPGRPIGSASVRRLGPVSAAPSGSMTERRPGPSRPAARREGRDVTRPRPRRRRPVLVGALAAAAAVVLVAVIIVGSGGTIPGFSGPVAVTAVADGTTLSADPNAAVRVSFSHPLDHRRTLAALRTTPAAAVTTSWTGDTLTIAPVHGFAPNTSYVLTVDAATARTSTGAKLAGDVPIVFGTAATAVARASGTPVQMVRKSVTAATDDAEAVVVGGDSLLVTSARQGTSAGGTDLARVAHGETTRLSAATDAICVSRSGQSVAYLAPAAQGTDVVFADASGTAQHRVPVAVDQGSPLGWIGDSEVSYVSGGRLHAVNRAGKARTVSDVAIDAKNDNLVIAPGGRYVYVQGVAPDAGRVIDLSTGAQHSLPGLVAGPAFSSDGATVVWVDAGTAAAPVAARLAVAASGGGTIQFASLPVSASDHVSDLAVSPDAAHFVYTVTHSDTKSELRLASLPDGATLAVSTEGAGHSPNWAPSGKLFTVLGQQGDQARIESVTVPTALADARATAEAVVTVFAYAQVSNDHDAQQALAQPGVKLPQVQAATRAAVLWVQTAADGVVTAGVRLTADATARHPVATAQEETLTLGQRSGAPPLVRSVSVREPAKVPAGPQLTRLDTASVPGGVVLVFDSDLDPASVGSAVTITAKDGRQLPATSGYDAATRTVTLRPSGAVTGAATVRIGPGLRDIRGDSAVASSVAVTLTR